MVGVTESSQEATCSAFLMRTSYGNKDAQNNKHTNAKRQKTTNKRK